MTDLSPALVGPQRAARAVLDSFGVPGRLRHIRDFIWRGGDITVQVDSGVAYELRAEWDSAVLAPTRAAVGLDSARSATVEGHWMRARAGYLLRVGIDFHVPSAISIWAGRPLASVPFVQRQPASVESALAADLARYADWFLDHCVPVPQARATANEKLTRLHLNRAR